MAGANAYGRSRGTGIIDDHATSAWSHDAVFRRILGEPANAASQLRAVLARPGGLEEFTSLLRYIGVVGEAPAEQLHKLVSQLGPQAEEAYMTTAEMLRAEGEARGEARGRAAMLVELLTLKFGPLPPAASQAIHAASRDQLHDWAARALTADTLDQVLPLT